MMVEKFKINFLQISNLRSYLAEPKCPQGRAYTDSTGKFYQCSDASICPVNYECFFDGQVYGCCPSKGDQK